VLKKEHVLMVVCDLRKKLIIFIFKPKQSKFIS